MRFFKLRARFYLLPSRHAPFCSLVSAVQLSPEQAASVCWLQYRVSMASTGIQAFFGNTWTSQELPVVDVNNFGLGRVVVPVFVYFHTSIRDPDVVLVVETVVLIRDPKTRELIGQSSAGWAVLNVLAPDRAVSTTSESARSVRGAVIATDVDLNTGSPAALFYGPHTSRPVPITSVPPSSPVAVPSVPPMQEGCKISYRFNAHPEFKPAQYLLAENEFVGSNTLIPGLLPVKIDVSRLSVAQGSKGSAGTRGPIAFLPCLTRSSAGGDSASPLNTERSFDSTLTREDDLLGMPHVPTLAPRVQLGLRAMVVQLPADFETKLLLAVTRNREIERAMHKGALKVRLLVLEG